ncbi:MAG: YbhB/YbcL family Raf kinase inhibitor-like protein [Gaiellaceae bacterium]
MWLLAVLVVVLGVAACGGDEDGEPPAAGPSAPGYTFAQSGVADGEPIESRYTCDGEDVSPALAWEGVPEETAELALVVEDPDAPGGTFTHWVAYGLDPGETELPEGVPEGGEVDGPPALRQGSNDFGTVGYGGPCPPGGETHDYVFRLLALDAETGLEGGASRDELLAAAEGHVLAEAQLTAPYSRP